jgi:hypothetical protein
MQRLVCVTASFGAARHIVEVVHSSKIEWNMAPTLDEGEIPARILDSRQRDQSAIAY